MYDYEKTKDIYGKFNNAIVKDVVKANGALRSKYNNAECVYIYLQCTITYEPGMNWVVAKTEVMNVEGKVMNTLTYYFPCIESNYKKYSEMNISEKLVEEAMKSAVWYKRKCELMEVK